MMRAAWCIALVLTASAHATPRTPYNEGVAAYRNQDYATARRQWETAVRQGDMDAHNNLGFLLYAGLGGATDPAAAVALWRKAAERGHAEAQWHLGDALAAGKGVEQDRVAAYAWYRCAAAPRKGGDEIDERVAEDARKSLMRLLDKLSAAQLADAEPRGRECVARYVH